MGAISVAIPSMLALTLVAFVSGAWSPSSVGFMINIASACRWSGDQRNLVVSAMGNQRVVLNVDPSIDISKVPARLHEILKYRAEKLVYVRAESNVSFGEFLQLIDTVRPEAEIISLITPQVETLVIHERHCLEPSCGECTKLRTTQRNSSSF